MHSPVFPLVEDAGSAGFPGLRLLRDALSLQCADVGCTSHLADEVMRPYDCVSPMPEGDRWHVDLDSILLAQFDLLLSRNTEAAGESFALRGNLEALFGCRTASSPPVPVTSLAFLTLDVFEDWVVRQLETIATWEPAGAAAGLATGAGSSHRLSVKGYFSGSAAWASSPALDALDFVIRGVLRRRASSSMSVVYAASGLGAAVRAAVEGASNVETSSVARHWVVTRDTRALALGIDVIWGTAGNAVSPPQVLHATRLASMLHGCPWNDPSATPAARMPHFVRHLDAYVTAAVLRFPAESPSATAEAEDEEEFVVEGRSFATPAATSSKATGAVELAPAQRDDALRGAFRDYRAVERRFRAAVKAWVQIDRCGLRPLCFVAEQPTLPEGPLRVRLDLPFVHRRHRLADAALRCFVEWYDLKCNPPFVFFERYAATTDAFHCGAVFQAGGEEGQAAAYRLQMGWERGVDAAVAAPFALHCFVKQHPLEQAARRGDIGMWLETWLEAGCVPSPFLVTLFSVEWQPPDPRAPPDAAPRGWLLSSQMPPETWGDAIAPRRLLPQRLATFAAAMGSQTALVCDACFATSWGSAGLAGGAPAGRPVLVHGSSSVTKSVRATAHWPLSDSSAKRFIDARSVVARLLVPAPGDGNPAVASCFALEEMSAWSSMPERLRALAMALLQLERGSLIDVESRRRILWVAAADEAASPPAERAEVSRRAVAADLKLLSDLDVVFEGLTELFRVNELMHGAVLGNADTAYGLIPRDVTARFRRAVLGEPTYALPLSGGGSPMQQHVARIYEGFLQTSNGTARA